MLWSCLGTGLGLLSNSFSTILIYCFSLSGPWIFSNLSIKTRDWGVFRAPRLDVLSSSNTSTSKFRHQPQKGRGLRRSGWAQRPGCDCLLQSSSGLPGCPVWIICTTQGGGRRLLDITPRRHEAPGRSSKQNNKNRRTQELKSQRALEKISGLWCLHSTWAVEPGVISHQAPKAETSCLEFHSFCSTGIFWCLSWWCSACSADPAQGFPVIMSEIILVPNAWLCACAARGLKVLENNVNIQHYLLISNQ